MAGYCCCVEATGECCCHEFDVVFLVDTSGSMNRHKDYVLGTIRSILTTYEHSKRCNWGLVQHRDSCDFPLASGETAGGIHCSGANAHGCPEVPSGALTFESGYEIVVPMVPSSQMNLMYSGLDCLEFLGGCDDHEQWLPALKWIGDNWTEDWTRDPWTIPGNTGTSGLCYPHDFFEGLTSPFISGETSCVTSCQNTTGKTQRNLVIHFTDEPSHTSPTSLIAAQNSLINCGIYYLGVDLRNGNDENQMCDVSSATCGWCFGCGPASQTGTDLDQQESGCSWTGTVEDLLCCILCRKNAADCGVTPPGCYVCCITPSYVELEITTPPTNLSCSDCADLAGTYILPRIEAESTGECCCYQKVFTDEDDGIACYDSILMTACFCATGTGNGDGTLYVDIAAADAGPGDPWTAETGLDPTIDCNTFIPEILGWDCCNPYAGLKQDTGGGPGVAYTTCDWNDVRVTINGEGLSC